MPVSDNLVAYFSLTSAAGTDATGRGNDLIPENVTSATGIQSTCAQFTTGAQTPDFYMTSTADVRFDNEDATWAGWVYMDSLKSYAYVLGKGVATEYALRFQTDKFYFGVNNFANYVGTTSTAFTTAAWYFLVAQHDATNDLLKLSWNNGSMDSAAAPAGGITGGTGNFLFGMNSSETWDGRIDEVGIWKRLLTTDQITWLYNSGAGRSYADIVAEGSPPAGGAIIFNMQIG